jgi:rare lipoprotein A
MNVLPRLAGAFVFVCLLLSGCRTPDIVVNPEQPAGPVYSPEATFVQEGIASWYGGRWIGRLTANGERYKAGDMTAAHKKLPFNTMVRVTDLKTGNKVIVRINNRGPYIKGRIIDLSVVAAKKLGTYDRGLAKVRIEALKEIPVLKKPNMRVPEKPVAKPSPAPAKAKPSPTPAKPKVKPSPTPAKPAAKPSPTPFRPVVTPAVPKPAPRRR